jgi:hypothetical protein
MVFGRGLIVSRSGRVISKGTGCSFEPICLAPRVLRGLLLLVEVICSRAKQDVVFLLSEA